MVSTHSGVATISERKRAPLIQAIRRWRADRSACHREAAHRSLDVGSSWRDPHLLGRVPPPECFQHVVEEPWRQEPIVKAISVSQLA